MATSVIPARTADTARTNLVLRSFALDPAMGSGVALYGDCADEAPLKVWKFSRKIRSTINNAHRALDLIDESGSLAAYFWAHATFDVGPPSAIPPRTRSLTASSVHGHVWSLGRRVAGCHATLTSSLMGQRS